MGDNFLREVDLSNNYIDSEAMEYIRQMVKTSDLIERIFNLSNNPVGITNETIISNIDKFIDVNFLILEPNQADEVEAKATGEIVEY